MSNIIPVWTGLINVDRDQSKLVALNDPVRAKDQRSAANRAKQEILNKSLTDYLTLVDQALTIKPTWGSIKTELISISPNILDTNREFPKLINHDGYYDYADSFGVYTVFAASGLGGGFRDSGWVQEESITAEFYEMALGIIDYVKNNEQRMSLKQSVIWFNLLRNSIANVAKYGGSNIRRESNDGTFDVNNYLSQNNNIQFANFISIDAIKRRDKTSPYTLNELQHLFTKALSGFSTVSNYGFTKLHTGHWGAGAFNNQQSIILLIQGLAAWITGIKELHYWGLRNFQSLNGDPLFNDIWNTFSLIGNNYSVRQVYDHYATVLGINFSLDQILSPLFNTQTITNNSMKWYWKDDNNQWIPYKDDIQIKLSIDITSPISSSLININGIDYIIQNIKGKWEQVRLDNNRRKREVLAPNYI